MASDIHITDFLKVHTQKQAAEIMGITQGAIHQAVAAERDIYFRECEPGRFTFYEIKKPRRRKAA